VKDVKTIKNTYVGTSIVSVLLGLFLVIRPEASGNAISYIIGACFIFYGVVHIVSYLISKDESFYQYDLAKGIITVTVGVFLIVQPSFVVSILPTLLGFIILVSGIFGLQSSINMLRRSPSKSWVAVFVPAVITIVLGILIVVNPFQWAKALLVVIGGCLIWNGVSNFWTHLCLSKRVKEAQTKAESIETTAQEGDPLNEDK
jgi:uncharacterized membrane protein HdeD (DUF308 family)